MVKKTKFSTITAVITTIATIAAMGSIGGIGLGQQQQTALAQPVDPRDILEDQIDVGGIGDTVRDILEEDDDNGGGELFTCDPDSLQCRADAQALRAIAHNMCVFVQGSDSETCQDLEGP